MDGTSCSGPSAREPWDYPYDDESLIGFIFRRNEDQEDQNNLPEGGAGEIDREIRAYAARLKARDGVASRHWFGRRAETPGGYYIFVLEGDKIDVYCVTHKDENW